MQTLATTNHKPLTPGRPLLILGLGAVILLLIAAISIPNLLRSRTAADQASGSARYQAEKAAESSSGPVLAGPAMPEVRQVVQTGSMHLTVRDPAAAWRSPLARLVLALLLFLTASGLLIYVAPAGRIAFALALVTLIASDIVGIPLDWSS